MDGLKDTELPDRCTDAPLKTPRHMRCTYCPPSPHDIWRTYGIGRTYRYTGGMQMYRHTEGVHGMYRGHMDVGGIQT